MTRTLPFAQTTKGEIAKEVYDGDITGIDFAIPQGVATMLTGLGMDYHMYVMSYKGKSTFGNLIHLGEAFFHKFNEGAGLFPSDLMKERDHCLPGDVEIEIGDNGVNPTWWVLHLESGVYRPVNLAQRWCEELSAVELKHVRG